LSIFIAIFISFIINNKHLLCLHCRYCYNGNAVSFFLLFILLSRRNMHGYTGNKRDRLETLVDRAE